jgi:oxygen-independent coproporphyrinogen III oxidase
MAGIYIHIPFCKKTCSYCDFYKTTLIAFIPDYIRALKKEITLRASYLAHEAIESIYFGGGTPSLCSIDEINSILFSIQYQHIVKDDCEITLEANPDDLSATYIKELASNTSVNRLSIGIQSFRDSDLVLLNRRHTANQASRSIKEAHDLGFHNLSIDLIYGLPGLSNKDWQGNIENALEAEHISAYHLTVEPGTHLFKMASKGLFKGTEEDVSEKQFNILADITKKAGFTHYEISNLARNGYLSRHNSNYWRQKKYLGLGPSAHSYDLTSRQWNVSDVKKYIEAINSDISFYHREMLNKKDQYNEYLMVSLRTMWGVDANKIRHEFGEEFHHHFLKVSSPFVQSGHLVCCGDVFTMNRQGWLISDYILSGLFYENS